MGREKPAARRQQSKIKIGTADSHGVVSVFLPTWLAKEKNIDPKTPVRDFRLRDRFSDLPFLHTAGIAVLEAMGLGSLARRIEESGAVQAIERHVEGA